ncbi:hypothetical protein KBB06_03220, partial [Candidatus Gracilibacteria bacterium]|nr:hypothetical protein [Candidatus Gracilibacteria bacterium]
MLKKKPVWQISSLAILAMIIASSLFFTYHSLFIQEPQNKASAHTEKHLQANWEEGGRFANYKPEDEILELRDAATKQFKNSDGSITAIFSAGPIHYLENGEWKETLINIEKNISELHPDYAFATVQTTDKRFYPAYSGEKGLLVDFGKEVFRDWINPEMRWLNAKGKTISKVSAAIVAGTADSNHVTYPSVYKSTDISFKQNQTNRKLDVILQDKSAIANMPQDAEEVAYCEQAIMPQHWSYKTDTDPENPGKIMEIIFNDSEGKEQIRFSPPEIYEKNNKDNKTLGRYSVKANGNNITICKIAKVNWLKAPERQFPVVVDPTATLSADTLGGGASYWSGTVGCQGSTTPTCNGSVGYYKWNADVDVGCWGTACPVTTATRRGWVYFPTSGIMNGSTVTNVVLWFYVYSAPSASTTMYACNLSTNPISASASTIYPEAYDGCVSGTIGTSASWYNWDLGTTYGDSYVQNSLSSPNWHATGFAFLDAPADNELACIGQYNNCTLYTSP